MSIRKIFDLSHTELKPRSKNQIWIKDVGFDEAPWYQERMGLIELEDFLEVAGEKIDYVKITTPQILGHPEAWLKRKIALYKRYSIQPYLDHGFFLRAYRKSVVDEAIKNNFNQVLIDTAGRLQNKKNLMEEYKKIANVTKKIDPNAPHNVILVLDATSGQNVLNQVEEFNKIIPITGIIMTKLDGTAKGGILLALAKKYKLPIIALGLGEKEDDLQIFEAEKFADAFTQTD